MRTTWQQLQIAPAEHKAGVYLLHDSVGVIAYVGYSRGLQARLAQHFAGSTPVGEYLAIHAPASHEWVIEVVEGNAQVERALIAHHNPPFNTVGRTARPTRILAPPVNPHWRAELRDEFVAMGIDDHLERAFCAYPLGLPAATSYHRWRKQWRERFEAQSLTGLEVVAKFGGQWVAGDTAFGRAVGAELAATVARLMTKYVADLREFCESVPMPEPNEFGRLPEVQPGKQVTARDVAIALGTWPEVFREAEEKALAYMKANRIAWSIAQLR